MIADEHQTWAPLVRITSKCSYAKQPCCSSCVEPLARPEQKGAEEAVPQDVEDEEADVNDDDGKDCSSLRYRAGSAHCAVSFGSAFGLWGQHPCRSPCTRSSLSIPTTA